MTTELLVLSVIVAMIASVAVIRPKALFQYPVAIALVMWFFILPQAWRIEASGEFLEYQPTLAWSYMILCIVATVVGFLVGRWRSAGAKIGTIAEFEAQYDVSKLVLGAIALAAVGSLASIMTYRTLATMKEGEAWSGPIAFYAFASGLLVFGATLGWILYLYTRNKRALAVALLGLGVMLPPILFSARRELTFEVAAVFLLGLLFVKDKTVSRVVLLPMILLGSVFINQAGAIRSYIKANDANLIEAITSDHINNLEEVDAPEMGGGVSDISVANWTGTYTYIAPYYNQIIQMYVPKFIVGSDIKDGLKMGFDDDTASYKRFSRGGATRTGFSDSFQAFHYFGWIVFFLISYFMGRLWSRARNGQISAQVYYIILISGGMKVITESTAVIITNIPLMLLSVGAVFAYAKKRKPRVTNTGVLAPAVITPRGSLNEFHL